MDERDLKEAGFTDDEIRALVRWKQLVLDSGGGEAFAHFSALERARLGFLRWLFRKGKVTE